MRDPQMKQIRADVNAIVEACALAAETGGAAAVRAPCHPSTPSNSPGRRGKGSSMPRNTINPDKIERWRPTHEKKWERKGDEFRADLYTDQGVVELFVYHGGVHGVPFTHMQIYISPHVFTVRLPRAYHQRWARRLASEFAWRCQQSLKTRNEDQQA